MRHSGSSGSKDYHSSENASREVGRLELAGASAALSRYRDRILDLGLAVAMLKVDARPPATGLKKSAFLRGGSLKSTLVLPWCVNLLLISTSVVCRST